MSAGRWPLGPWALGALLGLALAAPAAAQGSPEGEQAKPKAAEPGPGEKGFKGGRVALKRDQGSAKELQAQLTAFMKRLAQDHPKLGQAAPAGQAEQPKDDGLSLPPARRPATPSPSKGDAAEGDAAKADATLGALRSFAPDKQALEDVLTLAGLKAVGKPIYKAARALFSKDVATICGRLGIRPDYQVVEVHEASREQLLGMDVESEASQHFAGGLKRAASYLKPGYRCFVVTLDRPPAQKALDAQTAPKETKRLRLDPADARLQVWVKSGKRYLLLGRIWRPEALY
ncbi:MAG TPA: hypothetical protein DEA08_16625 [Planctomycetes bacterium]|nr:hypothetical protein [Planctomycetota bacterium]